MKKILSLVCALALALSLCACGSAAPTEVTGQFLDALKAQDADAMKAVYEDSEGMGDIDGIFDEKALADDSMKKTAAYFKESLIPKLFDFDYKLSNEKIDGDKATVDVTFTTYALGDAFAESVDDMLAKIMNIALSNPSDDEIDTIMRDAYKKNFEAAKKDYTKTVTVSLSKTDDGWVVDEFDKDSEFIDAICGGMLDAISKVGKSMGD